MTKHTALPWHIGIRTAHSKRDVYGERGELVVLADGVFTPLETAQENAAFIVRACNAHDELVAALALAHAHLEYCGYGDSWERECAKDSGLDKKIRGALAKARGET